MTSRAFLLAPLILSPVVDASALLLPLPVQGEEVGGMSKMQTNNHIYGIYRTGYTSLRRAILIVLLFAINPAVYASTNRISPSGLYFGSQAVGTASAPKIVQFTNYSQNQMRVYGIATSRSQFIFSGPALPITLGPGQSLTGSVIFDPATAQSYSGELIVTFNTGWKDYAYLNGTGVATSVPSAAVWPSITTQPAGQTVTAGQTASFSVANTGTAPFSYQWYKNTTAISGATAASYTTPATTTSDSGALFKATVTNSAGTVTSDTATLTVNAAPTSSLTVNPSSLAFGTIAIGANSTIQTTVANSGTTSVTISNVSISGAGFAVSGVSTGQILVPGQSTTLSVSFTPATNAGVTGSVTIMSNATNSPTAVSLSGTGLQSVSHDAVLSWNASATPVIGYHVYRGQVSGGPYTKVTSAPVATTSDVDSTVQSGSTYFYTVTSIDSSNVESAFSNETSAIIP